MEVGKLSLELLAQLLARHAHPDPRVKVGPQVGEDAAVIDMGDLYLVATSDPITFVTDQLGYYGVNVNANDIATRGATPRWFLATLLLPETSTTPQMVEEIFSQLSRACQEMGVSLIGGHTEVTHGLDRPILSGHMLGEVAKGELVTTQGATPGDLILLTKGICVEGTSVIARLKEKELQERGFSKEWIERAKDFLFHPGISVVPEALAACRAGKVNAMHDPTEGGLATALHELAMAAGVGLRVEEKKISVYPETFRLCREYSLDPLGTLSSGALLLTLPPSEAEGVLEAIGRLGVPAAIIGEVLKDRQRIELERESEVIEIPSFERDEITKIF